MEINKFYCRRVKTSELQAGDIIATKYGGWVKVIQLNADFSIPFTKRYIIVIKHLSGPQKGSVYPQIVTGDSMADVIDQNAYGRAIVIVMLGVVIGIAIVIFFLKMLFN